MWALLCLALALHGSISAVGAKRALTQSPGAAMPLSATPAMLANDPQGRGALLNALGTFGSQYQPQYTWSYTAAHYMVSPSLDPGTGVPKTSSAAQVGSFQVTGDSVAYPVHAVPFPNNLMLFLTRGNNANGTSDNPLLAVDNGQFSVFAGIYNMSDNGFRPFEIREHPFCAGHTLLPDGNRAIIVGGDNLNLAPPHLINGIQVIRVFDSLTQTYEVVATMDRGRWYPSVMTFPDGSILILGGSQQEASGWAGSQAPSDTVPQLITCSPNAGGSIADPTYDNPSYQIFYPQNNTLSNSLTLTILLQGWPINLYPFAAVMPTGSVLVISGSNVAAMYLTPDGATQDEEIGQLPNLPIPVNYPQSGSFTLLPQQAPDWDTYALLAGGSGEFCSSQQTPASQNSFLLDLTVGHDHSLVTEDLAFPRVMGELTLLPDGNVLLCNGCQVGTAGGAGPNAGACTTGTTVCELYNPSMPIGQRWSPLGDSGIWRLYHSWAFLQPNATVLIGGSDSTAERRIQTYTPYYLLNGKPRPTISSAPATLTYGQNFTFSFGVVSTLDRVVLSRFTTATHGTHADQRQLVIDCQPGSGTVTCTTPPNGNIAPPGVYMLFGLNEGTPSEAAFVNVGPTGGIPEDLEAVTPAMYEQATAQGAALAPGDYTTEIASTAG